MDSFSHIGSADSGVSVSNADSFEVSDAYFNSEFIQSSEKLLYKFDNSDEISIPIKINYSYNQNAANMSADLESSATKPNQISHFERLIRSHSIWFIPDLSRDDAVMILHAKEEGVSLFYI